MFDPAALNQIAALGGALAPIIVAMVGYIIRRERTVERRLTRIETHLGIGEE